MTTRNGTPKLIYFARHELTPLLNADLSWKPRHRMMFRRDPRKQTFEEWLIPGREQYNILLAVKIEVSIVSQFPRSERKHHQRDNFQSLPDFSMTSIQAARGISQQAFGILTPDRRTNTEIPMIPRADQPSGRSLVWTRNASAATTLIRGATKL